MVKLEARKPTKTVGHLILSYDPLSGQSDFRLKYSQFPLYLFPSILTCQHTSNVWVILGISEYHQDLPPCRRATTCHQSSTSRCTWHHSGNGDSGYLAIPLWYSTMYIESNQYFQLVSYSFSCTCRSRRMQSGCCPGATWPECSSETFGRSLTY